MRVTENSLYGNAQYLLGKGRERVDKASNDIASGLRVSHPGDDPAAAALDVELKAELSRHVSQQAALGSSITELNAADSALGSITDSVRRAYELSMQVGSDTYSEVNRQQAAIEVDGLFQQVVAQLNTKVGNRFIFGGTQDDAPAYLEDGTYMGDDGEHRVEVAPGLTETVSVGMDKLIRDPEGVDVLGTLSAVSQAMKAGDGNAIRSLSGTLMKGFDQVLAGRVKAGATTNLLEMAVNASQTLQDAATKNKSSLVDTDIIEAASRLALGQRALDAAMAAATKSFDLTLLSRFR
jgi:flagellar hook-associated protein 3 FlgL